MTMKITPTPPANPESPSPQQPFVRHTARLILPPVAAFLAGNPTPCVWPTDMGLYTCKPQAKHPEHIESNWSGNGSLGGTSTLRVLATTSGSLSASGQFADFGRFLRS